MLPVMMQGLFQIFFKKKAQLTFITLELNHLDTLEIFQFQF